VEARRPCKHDTGKQCLDCDEETIRAGMIAECCSAEFRGRNPGSQLKNNERNES